MSNPMFDMRLRAMRRDRAFRTGTELFLHERAFSDILDRLSLVRRRFDRALLIGCPDPGWKQRLAEVADTVDALESGPLFAREAGGDCVIEDVSSIPHATFDLCVAVGTLDTVNDLPGALKIIRTALKPDSLLIGAIGGGDMLPQLRAAMRAADGVMGAATPHVHPRIDASSLAGLLSASGFAMPVVDVDSVRVSYASLKDLVRDLRAMGATNILQSRSKKPLSRRAVSAAEATFQAAGAGAKTVERFDLLHFAAWTPSATNERG